MLTVGWNKDSYSSSLDIILWWYSFSRINNFWEEFFFFMIPFIFFFFQFPFYFLNNTNTKNKIILLIKFLQLKMREIFWLNIIIQKKNNNNNNYKIYKIKKVQTKISKNIVQYVFFIIFYLFLLLFIYGLWFITQNWQKVNKKKQNKNKDKLGITEISFQCFDSLVI